MKRLCITFAALAFAASAQAADLSLQLHGLSHHFSDPPKGQTWNEVNTGAGLRAQFTPEWGAQFGAYRNSVNKNSAYAIAQWTPLEFGRARFGAFAGVASGYKHGPLVAGVMLTVPVGNRFSFTVRAVPSLPKTSGVVSVEAGWAL